MFEERPVGYDEAKNEISKVHVFPRPLNILTEECFFCAFCSFPKGKLLFALLYLGYWRRKGKILCSELSSARWYR